MEEFDKKRRMPAQQLERGREKVAVMKMGGSLPANSSSAALVSTKTVENAGLLQPEFRPASHAASGHITTRQWVTVAVLVYVNLINYMDRLTLAGEVTTLCVSGIDFRSSQGRRRPRVLPIQQGDQRPTFNDHANDWSGRSHISNQIILLGLKGDLA